MTSPFAICLAIKCLLSCLISVVTSPPTLEEFVAADDSNINDKKTSQRENDEGREKKRKRERGKEDCLLLRAVCLADVFLTLPFAWKIQTNLNIMACGRFYW